MPRWIPAASMLAVSLISYIDRNTLAIVAPTILRETGLSAEQRRYADAEPCGTSGRMIAPAPQFVLAARVLDVLYRRLLRPILFRFDAERVHHLAMAFLHGLGPIMQSCARKRSARLLTSSATFRGSGLLAEFYLPCSSTRSTVETR